MKKAYQQILKDAEAVAESVYAILPELPEDEKWNTTAKLRNSTNDFIFFTAQAVGHIRTPGQEYDLDMAHKYANALRTLYVFAGKQNFINIDPDVVVKLDRLMKRFEAEADVAKGNVEDLTKQELEPWYEKYRLWKEMQS